MKNNLSFFQENHPITTKLCFFKLEFNKILAMFEKRQKDLINIWSGKYHCNLLDSNLNLKNKIELLNPLSHLPNQYLISETQSDWCLYIENGLYGTDAFSQPSYLAEEWKVEYLALYLDDNLDKGQHGAIMFHWGDGAVKESEYQIKSRTVLLHKETEQLNFLHEGTPFPFEHLESYKKRVKRERLTIEMIGDYCNYFGIRLFDLDFYIGKSALIFSMLGK